MYFPFFILHDWGKRSAEARSPNCAVLPYIYFFFYICKEGYRGPNPPYTPPIRDVLYCAGVVMTGLGSPSSSTRESLIRPFGQTFAHSPQLVHLL